MEGFISKILTDTSCSQSNRKHYLFFSGISSLVFTRDAEALYLHSSSELQRISLATSGVTQARCYLALPEGARDDATSDAEVDTEKQEDGGAPLLNGNAESKESSVADKV